MDATGGTNDNTKAPSANRAARPSSWTYIGAGSDGAATKETLIRANVAILESFLTKIAAKRAIQCTAGDILEEFVPSPEDKRISFAEEPSEAILFPDWACDDVLRGAESVAKAYAAVSAEVRTKLHEYVTTIASLYRDVPFHNFAHASHVTASANELLNRMCTTVEDDEDAAAVAARTFGISADPLAQFTVVLASLVHDVDHRGVPNARLVKEADPLASRYDNRSVAEKRSVSVAWDVLMEDRFRALRSAVFVNGDELRRFRRLLVHAVLATDIADEELSTRTQQRWRRAFCSSRGAGPDGASTRSLKATLVLEQIMQASDVAHAMQHWETFKRWNARLYQELAKAHREGREPSDPRAGWYEGEIRFFDGYVLPLTKRLEECGALGLVAGECLERAVENRRQLGEEGAGTARAPAIEDDWFAAKVYAASRSGDPSRGLPMNENEK